MGPDDPIVTRIVIRRNQSLDRRGLAWALAVLALPVGGYATLAAVEGMWPILTFCVGAFLVFAAVLYGVMMASHEREVVTITARHVVVEGGRFHPRIHVELDRYWTRVEERRGRRPALALIARGVVVLIATALTEEERKTLARRLQALVGVDAGRGEALEAPTASGPAHVEDRR